MWDIVSMNSFRMNNRDAFGKCGALLQALYALSLGARRLRNEKPAEAHIAQSTPVGDRAAIRHDMGFHSRIKRKAFGLLRFHNPLVLPEYPVVEIVHVLHRQISVKIAGDRREQTSYFR